MNFDRTVAAASIAVYVASVLALLPPSGYLRMLGGGAVVFAAVMAIAHVRRNRAVSGWSVFAISIAAAAVLVVPGFPAMGGRDSAAVPVGLFGSQAAAVLWVTLRWSPEEPAKHRTSLKGALVYSVLGGMCLGLIATIPIVIAIITDRGIARSLLLVYPSYFFGTAAVAVTYWLLQTITHRPVGRYLLGVLGGFCMYAAVGPVVDIVEGDPIDIRELLVSAAVCGLPSAHLWQCRSAIRPGHPDRDVAAADLNDGAGRQRAQQRITLVGRPAAAPPCRRVKGGPSWACWPADMSLRGR